MSLSVSTTAHCEVVTSGSRGLCRDQGLRSVGRVSAGMGAAVMVEESSSKSSYVPNEVRTSVVAALLAIRRTQTLPTWRVRSAAADLQVSPRAVWRWLEQAECDGRTIRKKRAAFVVGQDDLVELAYHRGNVGAVHRARVAAGKDVPSLAALRRAYARALSPGRRAGIIVGERARRDYDTYLPRPAGRHRNDCWEADHTQLAVHVALPDGRVVMPWATLFVDQASRVILGWAIAVTPSQETVLGALRAAIDIEAPNGPMGGVPAAIRFDRARSSSPRRWALRRRRWRSTPARCGRTPRI
jgi:putative transposase